MVARVAAGLVLLSVSLAAVGAGPAGGLPAGTSTAWPRSRAGAATGAFIWPVEDPSIRLVYGCKACYSSRSPRYSSGINTHTGVDVRPSGAGDDDFTVPVHAAAGGLVEGLVPYGSPTGGLGNTVILRHENGKFSVYGHLDSFAGGLSVGKAVAQGEKLGLMGNSGITLKGHTYTHVHFEIKETPTVGNTQGGRDYFGYTPGHPDLYAYHDPREFVEAIAVDTIPETAIRALPPGPVPVRASPGETYVSGVGTAITDSIEAGRRFVAFKHAFVEGRDWYFVHLPSANKPERGSRFPNNGPSGGWVDGDLVTLEPGSAQVEVLAERVVVRKGPRRRAPLVASVYRGERFVVSGTPRRGGGCRAPKYPIHLSIGTGASEGWICGDRVAER